jgi:hypothetical protein
MDLYVPQQNSADELKGTAIRLEGPGVRIPAKATKCFQVQNVQNGSGVHSVSYSMSTGFFPASKAAVALS